MTTESVRTRNLQGKMAMKLHTTGLFLKSKRNPTTR